MRRAWRQSWYGKGKQRIRSSPRSPQSQLAAGPASVTPSACSAHPRLQQRLGQQVGAAAGELTLEVPAKHAATLPVPRARHCRRGGGGTWAGQVA